MEKSTKFATTRWSLVHQLDSQDDGAAALQELCQAYWRPILNFVQQRGHDAQAAQDITQSFFAYLLEHGTLMRADPSRGKFRTFLLSALKNFMTDLHRRTGALKRGGDLEFIRFDEEDAQRTIDPAITPDRCFEQSWAASVVRRSLERLGDEYQRAGKTKRLDLLKPYLLSDPPSGRYGEIAAELQISDSALRSAVQRMRQRFRHVFRLEVAETVDGEEAVDEEIRYLLSVL